MGVASLSSCDEFDAGIKEGNSSDSQISGIEKNQNLVTSQNACNTTINNLRSHIRVIFKAGNHDDVINVSENNDDVIISTAANTCYIPKPLGELVIYGEGGNDAITIDASMGITTIVYSGDGEDIVQNMSDTDVTIVSLGDGSDQVIGNGQNTRFWLDPEDTHNASSIEQATGKLNVVATFENANKVLNGPEIADHERFDWYADNPVPWEYLPMSETSLWGVDLPTAYDVQQGFFQTCNTTGRWASIVNHSPEIIRELAVELGDGTYGVKISGNRFVRIDQDIIPFHLSRPSPAGKAWYVVLEKAYSDLNLEYEEPFQSESVTKMRPSEYPSENSYLQELTTHLANKRSLTANSIGKNLDIGVSRFHVHTVLGIEGNKIIIRNPYGDVYDALYKPTYNPEHGRVALTFVEFQQYFTEISVSQVQWQ